MNAMPPPDIATVASIRARLWDAGFRPVALKTADKRPLTAKWQEQARRNPPADAEDQPTTDRLNTGILADGLRIVDVDVDDAALAHRLRTLAAAMLGDTLIRTRQGTGRSAMIYRAAEGEPNKRVLAGKFGNIEVLGRGQQLHAYGPHPSGTGLSWAPDPPHMTRVDTLPAMTEAQIDAFLAECAALIQAKPQHTKAAAGGHTGPANEAALMADIISGASFHDPVVKLAGKWALGGVPLMTARDRLLAAFDAVPDAARDERWRQRRADVDRCLLDIYGKDAGGQTEQPDPDMLANPDMSVLRLGRRAPPALPLDVFGPHWSPWIADAADAAGAPPDYVVVPLLAAASALVGHARWAQAWPGWTEPPHIWAAAVGDSGSSKSPGADCLLRDVLPVVEDRMQGDFPDRLADWRAKSEAAAAATERWKADVRAAQKDGHAPPLPPPGCTAPEPQAPRLRQSDVTVEKVATLLAHAAPKGLLIVRDELAGWLLGMNAYNDAARPFWIEAYGGRPYRVERQKHPEPIKIPRLAVAVTGTTQPSKLAEMFRDPDDGLLGRFVWAWPEPLPFRRGRASPATAWAGEALDKLRMLDLTSGPGPDDPPRPVIVPLSDAAAGMMEVFGQDMQRRQQEAGGLMQSAYGKARGLALRLSLVLAMLRWCARPGMEAPPAEIGEDVFGAACDLVADYLMPMGERVFGDAAATQTERNAATLARWIVRTKAAEVHIRKLLREVRLPGLTDAETVRSACAVLVEAGWLTPPPPGGFQARARAAYAVNPLVHEKAA